MNKYFIVKRSCGFVGDIYQSFSRESQEVVDNYMRTHSNCELIFATAHQAEFIAELDKLRKAGINVY